MWFLIALLIASIVYIKSFKSDFTEEHINKVQPVLVLGIAFVILLGVLQGMLGR